MPLHDPDLSRVTTLLCDADGNLFPSEDPAFDASVDVTNDFLAAHGFEERYTAGELRALALGRNFRGLAGDLAAERGVRLAPGVLDEWVATEARVVTAHLGETLLPDEATSGVLAALAEDFSLAVVSSSALARLAACFTVTGLDDLFPHELRFSAQDSLPVPTSKPDPAVYLHALDQLGLEAEESVAIEDAVSGVRSAVAAGIATIGNLVHVAADERDVRRAALSDAGAFAVVEDWDEVRALLAGGRSRPALSSVGRS